MSKRNWFWGVILVLAAVLIIAAQFTSFATIGFWSILGGVVLAGAFVSSLVRLNFTGMFLSASLLYSIFQAPLGLPHINFWILVFASLVAGWGLSLITNRRARYGGWDQRYTYTPPVGELPEGTPPNGTQPGGEGGGGTEAVPAQTSPVGGDNHPRASVTLGGSTRYLHADALESGEFSALFGGLEVYFDQATLADGHAQIDVSATVGGVTLYVPRTWRVEERVATFLGGVSNERKFASPTPDSPLLVITGNVSFGGISIEYV